MSQEGITLLYVIEMQTGAEPDLLYWGKLNDSRQFRLSRLIILYLGILISENIILLMLIINVK